MGGTHPFPGEGGRRSGRVLCGSHALNPAFSRGPSGAGSGGPWFGQPHFWREGRSLMLGVAPAGDSVPGQKVGRREGASLISQPNIWMVLDLKSPNRSGSSSSLD